MNNTLNTTINRIPVIPEPPHDPTYLLLNSRVGWRNGKQSFIEITPDCGEMELSPVTDSGRLLTEHNGSFGGLTMSATVAIGSDGSIYLLDKSTNRLKKFEPCTCQFKEIPCIGGKGHGAMEFLDPKSIAIYGGNLYVTDAGNHRLSIFALHGYVLRDVWASPTEAALTNPWQPCGVAFDSCGHVYVSDPANGLIHRFNPIGSWDTAFSGFGMVTHLAIDCHDRLYALIEAEEKEVLVVDRNGQRLDTVTRSEEIVAYFPGVPFKVDASGNLYLEELCIGRTRNEDDCSKFARSTGVFDINGNPLKENEIPAPRLTIYEKKGFCLTKALDSKLYKCQWHRIILKGRIPSGTTVQVHTFTAETLLPESHILALPDEEWETNQTAHRMEHEEWDCLIRSVGGRYLWVRLEFRGNGQSTPTLKHLKIEFPRISLRRYLPAVFGVEPMSSDFTDRFLETFDTTLRNIERKIDYQAGYFDPMSTPADSTPKNGTDFLSWLASWIGIRLDRHWPEAKRRQFVKKAAQMFHIRGTREGLWRQLLFLLGMEPEKVCCQYDEPKTTCCDRRVNGTTRETNSCNWQPPPLILEHFQLRRWLFLGSGRLGDQAILWGKRIVNRSQLGGGARVDESLLITTQDPFRDPFHVYAHKFSVFVPACYGKSDRHRKGLENIINTEKPAHTHYQIIYVEPRFRIGFQSMIGYDSVVGRYPEGVILNEAPLGKDTVLGKSPDKLGGPTMEVGKHARIGSTTRLS